MIERRIKKLKMDGGRIEITAIETWGVGNEREWTLRCYDEPDPKLPAALAKVPDEVRSLLGLPRQWADGAMKVISVSWSWSESTSVAGASICVRADLECATSPLIINTPHLPYDQYSPGGTQPTMPYELREVLDEVEEQARRYMAGDRAQADLFAPKGKAAAAGEASEASAELAPA